MKFKLIGQTMCSTRRATESMLCPELFTISSIGVNCNITISEDTTIPRSAGSSLVNQCLESGINFFEISCRQNSILDGAIAHIRNKIILTATSELNTSFEETLSNINECCRRAETSYIDLCLIHCTYETPIEEIMLGMRKLLQSRTVNGVGLCGDLTPELIRRANDIMQLTLIQLVYDISSIIEKRIREICAALNIPITVFSPDKKKFSIIHDGAESAIETLCKKYSIEPVDLYILYALYGNNIPILKLEEALSFLEKTADIKITEGDLHSLSTALSIAVPPESRAPDESMVLYSRRSMLCSEAALKPAH